MRVKRGQIELRVTLNSGKKFYEENYPDVWACINASKKDAFKRFRKKYLTASITYYHSRSDFERLEWYIVVDPFYTTRFEGYVCLSNVKGYIRKNFIVG